MIVRQWRNAWQKLDIRSVQVHAAIGASSLHALLHCSDYLMFLDLETAVHSDLLSRFVPYRWPRSTRDVTR